jgi:hypothetical protein
VRVCDSAVQIGPRLELQLIKVQEGLAEGRVLYHRFEQRAAEDVATQEVERAEAARLKAERRREQEENVRKKAHEASRVAAAQRVRRGCNAFLLCAALVQVLKCFVAFPRDAISEYPRAVINGTDSELSWSVN